MQRRRNGTLSALAGGLGAIAAGLCWIIKGSAILVTGDQPALLFELAPSLMAVAVVVLGSQLPHGRARGVCLGAGAASFLLGLGVLVDQVRALPTVASSIAVAGANLLVLACLVVAGSSLRRRLGSRLPLGLGLVTVPALLLGGLAAALVGERALELPLVVLGVAWTALGERLARGHYAHPSEVRVDGR